MKFYVTAQEKELIKQKMVLHQTMRIGVCLMAGVLFQGEVNAVLLGGGGKGLDVLAGDFDGG